MDRIQRFNWRQNPGNELFLLHDLFSTLFQLLHLSLQPKLSWLLRVLKRSLWKRIIELVVTYEREGGELRKQRAMMTTTTTWRWGKRWSRWSSQLGIRLCQCHKFKIEKRAPSSSSSSFSSHHLFLFPKATWKGTFSASKGLQDVPSILISDSYATDTEWNLMLLAITAFLICSSCALSMLKLCHFQWKHGPSLQIAGYVYTKTFWFGNWTEWRTRIHCTY